MIAVCCQEITFCLLKQELILKYKNFQQYCMKIFES